MASTMQFTANSTTTEAFPRRNSISGFIGYRSNSLLIRRIANSRVRRSSFAVKCMFGSEAKQKLQDHELQQQGLKYFTLYAFSSAFCFTVMILVSLGFDIFDLVSDLLN